MTAALHPLHAAHAAFIAAVAKLPSRIPLSGANEQDVIDRDEYLRNLTTSYLRFAAVLTGDLNENLPVGTKVDFAAFLREFTELASDRLLGPLSEARHAVELEREYA